MSSARPDLPGESRHRAVARAVLLHDNMSTASTILCPLDFSPASERALERACELASALGQSLELLHVYQLPYLPEPPVGMGMGMTLEGQLWMKKQATELLEKRKLRVEQAGLKAAVCTEEGSPARVICERAQAPEISAVVMGTHGRSGLGRALLGSVAERVLRTVKVPVMTVRSSE